MNAFSDHKGQGGHTVICETVFSGMVFRALGGDRQSQGITKVQRGGRRWQWSF